MFGNHGDTSTYILIYSAEDDCSSVNEFGPRNGQSHRIVSRSQQKMWVYIFTHLLYVKNFVCVVCIRLHVHACIRVCLIIYYV